jgi:AraC family transcriptional regulator
MGEQQVLTAISNLGAAQGHADRAETTAQQRLVEQVLAVMRQDLATPLSLHALAECAGLSPFHFARVFRRVTGIPPGAFLAALRLEEAKRLLLTTDLPVTDICFAVGYQGLGTFTARFTRLVGVPPTQLRRLPELLAAIDFRAATDNIAPHVGGADCGQVAGRIEIPDATARLIAVGLFPAAIPQGRPVSGAVLAAPGPFRCPVPPDGTYHLLAATLPATGDPLVLLLPDAGLRVGRSQDALRVAGGRVYGNTTVTLRPMRATDPPLLVAVPAFLLDMLAARDPPG